MTYLVHIEGHFEEIEPEKKNTTHYTYTQECYGKLQ